jgi:hypothetical protein
LPEFATIKGLKSGFLQMVTTQKTTQSLYEQDFNLWLNATATQLKQRNFEAIDLGNLIEEIEAMGRSDRRELSSRLIVLIFHLLKWKYQSAHRSASWESTIDEQRNAIALILEDSPSLKQFVEDEVEKRYPMARKKAAKETRLPTETFPIDCPFLAVEILDFDFYPE